MKKLLFLSALIAGSLTIHTADAQVGIHLNLNLGPRLVYAPAPQPVEDEYYYLPDAEAYYSMPEHVYYYQDEGRWVSAPRLEGRFHDYDYSRMRHFAVNEPRPYLRNNYYRERYHNQQFAARDNREFRDPHCDGPHDRGDYGRNDHHFDSWNQNQRYQNHDDRGRHDDRGGRQNNYSRY